MYIHIEDSPTRIIHIVIKVVGIKFNTLAKIDNIIVINADAANDLDAVFEGFFNIETNEIMNTLLNIPWNNQEAVEVFTHSTICVEVVTFVGGSNKYAIKVFHLSKMNYKL